MEKKAPTGELILYQTEDGTTRLQLRMHEGTVWLTQRQLAQLYQVSVPAISQHISHVFEEGEANPAVTVKQFLTVRTERNREVSRTVDHYALPIVLAIGYRVRSLRGTQFRQWATERLQEYLVKGFTMDDVRLANQDAGAHDYFDELLERIRRIRASERRFYQKITDIYATAVDYRNDDEVTQRFYATVQNKLHWAIHGHTAAEVIVERANAGVPHMGLTTWAAAPSGRIRKTDVAIAKNYLSAEELTALDRVVTMYLDYAEDQASKRKPMTMADWAAKLDSFLQFNERNVLSHTGRISHELAVQHANAEFERYDAEVRRIEAAQPTSDFDHLVEVSKEVAKALPSGTQAGRAKKKQ